MQRLGVERRLQGTHLVKKHAERPNVRLETVPFALDNFGGKIVWRSNDCLCAWACIRKHSSYSEISQFKDASLRHEDILGLKIAMKDFLVVTMFDSQTNLRKPVKYLIFCKVLGMSLSVFHLLLRFDLRLKITIVAKVHHYAQFAFLRLVDFSEACDVRVVEYFKNSSFLKRFFSFIFTHVANVDLLDDCFCLVRLALDQVCCSKAARSQRV